MVKHKPVTVYTLTHKIECATPQKATACRDRLATLLDEDDDVTLVQTDMAQSSQRFRVVGVDIAAKAPFSYDVEAADEQAAVAKVTTNQKIVASVSPA